MNVVYYQNYKTKIIQLASEDLKEVSEFGVDLFYNLDHFVPNDLRFMPFLNVLQKLNW